MGFIDQAINGLRRAKNFVTEGGAAPEPAASAGVARVPAIDPRPNFTMPNGSPTAGPDIGGFRDPGVLPEAGAAPAGVASTATEAGQMSRLGRASYNVGKVAQKVAGPAATLARGAAYSAPLAGFGDYHIDEPGVDSSAGGVLKNAVTGNFSDAWNGLRKGAVEAGLDSVSGIAKTADSVGGLVGANLGLHRAFDDRVRADLGNLLPPKQIPGTATAPAVAPATNQTAAETQRLSNIAPVVQSASAAPAASAAPTAPVPYIDNIKVNTSVGDNGLRTLSASGLGQSPLGADGKPIYSSINGVPVNQIDGKPAYYGDPNSEYNRQVRDGLIADRNGLIHTPASNVRRASGTTSIGTEDRMSALVAQQQAVLNNPNATPLQRGTAMNIINHAGGQLLGLEGTKYSADKSSAASMYGHELGLRQAQVQREWDRQKFGIEQNNKERQFALDEGKYGLELSKENRAAHEAAVKNFTDQLDTMFTTKDSEGKIIPDKARVGDAMSKIMEEIGARIQDLRNVSKTDPNYARAQQTAELLSKRGLNALDEEDRRELLSQLELRDRVKQQHGILPGSSNFVDSRLSGYAQKGSRENTFGSNTLTLRNGGNVREADTRYTEPANAVLPDWFKRRTDKFNAGLGRD